MSLLEHAQRYAELGLRVFPLEPGKKTPAISEWPTKATTDRATISGWWRGGDPRGIGLACGDQIGEGRFLFVLDLDEHDPAHSGAEALRALEAANGPLPDTPIVLTPTGGSHIYLTAPEPITNARGRLPKGIDVRGRGGFVVLPPSVHPDGGAYEHEASATLGELRIAPAPGWLLDLLRPDEASPETRTAPRTASVWDELDDRPATLWAASTSWAELLAADGWTFSGTASEGHEEWTRPGKHPRDGISATVGYGGADKLKVFSENAPLPPGSWSKLAYWAHTRHGGDYSAAAKSVATPYATGGVIRREDALVASENGFEPVSGDWETPTAIAYDHEPPSFPLDVLPEWIREHVEQVATEMQVAADLPAMMALGALSTLAGGRARVRVDGPWIEGVNLYLVVALPPGAGKSPVFKLMIEKPLGDYEVELEESSAAERRRVETRRKIIEKEREKAINSGETALALAKDDELAELPEVVVPKLFVDDVTVEKLTVVLKEQGGRVALVSTEGGVFTSMIGRYSDVSFLDPYLQAWSGDKIRVDRLGRDDLVVREPALTIAVTVQPSVIEKLSDKPELRGRGLTARFMFSFPPDSVGTRDFDRDSTFDPDVAAQYDRRIVWLATKLRDAERPLDLYMSREATLAIRGLKKRHEIELAEYGRLAHMREWVVKCQSSVARLAALLHIADGNLDPEIDVSTVRRAIIVGDYWTEHARRVHDLFDADVELSTARKLLDFVRAHVEPGASFSVRDVTQWSRTGPFRKTDAVVGPLGLLVENRWIRPDFEGPITTGRGKTSPTFTLSPIIGDRLTKAHSAHYHHDQRTATTESSESEPMSLMSQEGNLRDISLSLGPKTTTEGETLPHEAHEAHSTRTLPCPL